MKILQPYKLKKKGSCYTVQGTYEELEEVFIKLQCEHTSTHVRSVDVSAAVMAYIEKKCKSELSKIQGNSFVIETQPGLRTVHGNPRGTVQVTLRPRHASVSYDRANMVRQRFITFYQRTASDLQVTSVSVSPHKQDDLQKRFPQLLFEAKQNKTEVTGPFMHIARLTEFIFQHTSSSRKSPVHKGRADGGGSRTSAPSPKHSKDHEDELCPICMDPIVTTKKVTLRCKHSFCKDCLKTAFDYKPVCPTCGKLYGTLTGRQPDGGRMNINTTSSSLPGYEKHGTIIIEYYIPSGIQKVRLHNTEQVALDVWSSSLTNSFEFRVHLLTFPGAFSHISQPSSLLLTFYLTRNVSTGLYVYFYVHISNKSMNRIIKIDFKLSSFTTQLCKRKIIEELCSVSTT